MHIKSSLLVAKGALTYLPYYHNPKQAKKKTNNHNQFIYFNELKQVEK